MRRWLLIPPVASLFAVSFYESWWALNKAAVAAKIPDPRPWPWAVDGFILVMALMVVFAAIDGHSWGTWWPRLGLLGATALSTGIQAAWAPAQDWAWALHAWSPLAVLSSFECLVWLVFGQAPARSKPERANGPPLPARAHAWLASWQLPEEVPAIRFGPPAGSPGHPVAESVAEPVAELPAEPAVEPATKNGSAKVRPLRPNERRRVERLAAEGLSANAISQRTKLPYKPVRQHLRLLETSASPNGDRP